MEAIPKEYNQYIDKLKLFGFVEKSPRKFQYKRYTVDILGMAHGNPKGHQLVAYLKKKRWLKEDRHMEYGSIQNVLVVVEMIKKNLLFNP